MSSYSNINILVGNTGTNSGNNKPNPIPRKWLGILKLAYAYTTSSIDEKLGNIEQLNQLVQEHELEIDELNTKLSLLGELSNDEFLAQLQVIYENIERIDPDLLLNLSYAYTMLNAEIVHNDSYSYAYSLYDMGINQAYTKIDNAYAALNNKINDIIFNGLAEEYVTYSYADATYAKKEDIPTKVSYLENDSHYVTISALSSYITKDEVDERIENIIDAAPENLDTLKEIADALGNDQNLAATLTEQISQRTTYEYVDSLYRQTTVAHEDIPIFDETKIQDLIDAGDLPDKYISIPSSETILQEGESGKYLDIIFNTLRDLQKQVSKIQRTFDKGLISMVNENTRMSYIANSEYNLIEESEPMWAVDPDTLSEITGAEFYVDKSHSLEPTANVVVSDGKLIISPYAVWRDNHLNITTNQPSNYLYDCPDAKEYVYITSSSTNIRITFTNYVDDENIIEIDLGTLGIPVTAANKYNILVCISRAVKNDTKYDGTNFLFVSIGDYFTGRNIWEGYYNKTTNALIKNSSQIIFNNAFDSDANERNRYYISKIDFNELELYRMNFYSKYQEFKNGPEPSVPDDDDTYSVAHITIRSVKNIEQLKKIKNQLLENELIYNDSNNCIYIIKDNEIKLISGGSTVPPEDDTTGMEKTEILEWLQANGIMIPEEGTDGNLVLNNIGDITFINQLNEKYKFSVDTDGELKGTLLNDNTLENRIEEKSVPINENATNFANTRGFIGTLREYETGQKSEINATANINSDMKLNADRVKIGNIYAPFRNQSTFGCTHGYIELENTSNQDYCLDGCYIHFVRRLSDDSVEEYSFPLSGTIYGGSTYLIRCKKYSDISQANTFINVDSFDVEWVTPEGELFDMYLGEKQNTFLLTYGCPGKDWDPSSNFDYRTTMTRIGGENEDDLKGWLLYHPCYIDSVSILDYIKVGDSGYTWCGWPKPHTALKESQGYYKNAKKLDALYKTTFELDPAKQAYQSLHWSAAGNSGKDSSRARSNTATDYQTVYLQKEYIEFPHSDEKYPVSMYTPMASYLHKNVCTDKTQLDMEKPNMVSVAFGIDMLKTRCFNWISAGDFDEYVWVRKQGTDTWKRFESYKTRSMSDLTETVVGSDGKETQIIIGHADSEYNTYRSKLTAGTLTAPYRKEFILETNNAVYARIKGIFPGSGVKYTSHKCIIDVVDSYVDVPTVYEYIVGRGDKNKNPDEAHISNVMTFTLYPSSYEPRLYQTTDQQGFHWIEYQTWAAAANKINEVINDQCAMNNIIPVVLNTGDATQNGTRINEWLDYYIGGKNLFNHLEQMSIVGNNDLCDNDPEILGTGDDSGKSNGFYHHVFYCYEVDEQLNDGTYISKLETHNTPENTDKTFDEVFDSLSFKYLPLIKGSDNVLRYIPSFYFYGTDKYTFVMMNSELTYVNCGQWFKRTKGGRTVNLYTGWTIPSKNDSNTYVPEYDNEFTTVYTMLYNIINEHVTNKISNEPTSGEIRNLIVACHEMPFTVVTAANLTTAKVSADRSLNGTSLVGSHMNMMNNLDKKSNYWFSRLLEYFNVKFVYGGHKHTYAITNEIRENYVYGENGSKTSIIDGKMPMEETLINDTAVFTDEYAVTTTDNGLEGADKKTWTSYKLNGGVDENITIATSKFPIMKLSDDVNNFGEPGITCENTVAFPYYGVNNDVNGIIYMMCQATGFKLKSNKELPGPNQRFSFIIPKTTPKDSPATDTPNNNQLLPMYTEIRPDTHTAYLIRMQNIHKGNPNNGETPAVLSQDKYGTGQIMLEYLHRTNIETVNMYGEWTPEITPLLTW